MGRTTRPAALPGPEGHVITNGTRKNEISVLFGRRLKAARLKARLSAAAVALRARTTVRHLRQIESGTTYPDLDLIGRLARVVGCEAYELLPDQRRGTRSRRGAGPKTPGACP